MCSICGHEHCAKRCPNYIPPRVRYYCSICSEGILNGEEYIINDNDEYAHWDCVDYANGLVKFLGYEIKTMEDEEL